MKIHIFGASGSGVSTLGQSLAKELNCAYFDTDDYYWQKTNPPYTTKNSIATREKLLSECLANYESWVLGGSLDSWSDFIVDEFDLVVFLYLPTDIRIERLKQREFARFGDAIFSDERRKQTYEDFIEWAAQYDKGASYGRDLKRYEAWLQTLTCPVLRIEGDMTNQKRIELVISFINSIG